MNFSIENKGAVFVAPTSNPQPIDLSTLVPQGSCATDLFFWNKGSTVVHALAGDGTQVADLNSMPFFPGEYGTVGVGSSRFLSLLAEGAPCAVFIAVGVGD